MQRWHVVSLLLGRYRSQCSRAENRTRIWSLGNSYTIHCTTQLLLPNMSMNFKSGSAEIRTRTSQLRRLSGYPLHYGTIRRLSGRQRVALNRVCSQTTFLIIFIFMLFRQESNSRLKGQNLADYHYPTEQYTDFQCCLRKIRTFISGVRGLRAAVAL